MKVTINNLMAMEIVEEEKTKSHELYLFVNNFSRKKPQNVHKKNPRVYVASTWSNHSFHELDIQIVKFIQVVNFDENTILYGHQFHEMDNIFIVYVIVIKQNYYVI